MDPPRLASRAPAELQRLASQPLQDGWVIPSSSATAVPEGARDRRHSSRAPAGALFRIGRRDSRLGRRSAAQGHDDRRGRRDRLQQGSRL